MKGPLGYGRYNEDPEYVGCPRAKSDMTPCVARDGQLALSPDSVDPLADCVFCMAHPAVLLIELAREVKRPEWIMRDGHVADLLRDLVREVTDPALIRE